MHRHLVAVKVRVESGTYKRMQLNGLAFHQNRLKCLDTKPVQRRGTVQHNRVFLDNLLKHIPHLGIQSLHQLFGVLDILGNSSCHQLLHNKGLEQLNCHLLGKTALINLKLRSHHDNGTSRIVNTLAQQVLTETSRFALKHIGQGFQRPVAGARYGSAPSAVVNQRVNRFLEHSLFVPDNNVGSAQLKKAF